MKLVGRQRLIAGLGVAALGLLVFATTSLWTQLLIAGVLVGVIVLRRRK